MTLNNVINGERKEPVEARLAQNPFTGDVDIFIKGSKDLSELHIEWHTIRVLYEYGKTVREINEKAGEEK